VRRGPLGGECFLDRHQLGERVGGVEDASSARRSHGGELAPTTRTSLAPRVTVLDLRNRRTPAKWRETAPHPHRPERFAISEGAD